MKRIRQAKQHRQSSQQRRLTDRLVQASSWTIVGLMSVFLGWAFVASMEQGTPSMTALAYTATPAIDCTNRTICPAALYYNRNESSEIASLNQHKLVVLNHDSQLSGPAAILPSLDTDTIAVYYQLFDFAVNSPLYNWSTVDANESWFLHVTNDSTRTGRIRYNDNTSPAYDYWFMDLTNSGYVDFRIAQYQSIMTAYPGLDGFFLDISGAHTGFGLYVLPYLGCTASGTCPSQLTSATAWDAARAPAYSALKSALSTVYLFQNNSLDPAYTPLVDASMGEEFGHPGFNDDSYWLSEAVWRSELDLVAGSQLTDRLPAVLCGFNGGDQTRMLRFCTAFYLLGRRADNTTLFTFSDERDVTRQATYYPLYDLDIGQPAADYVANYLGKTGLYARTYELGLVLSNPTASAIDTGNLGATYIDLDGNVVSSVTLAAHTAQILTMTDATAPAAVTNLSAN